MCEYVSGLPEAQDDVSHAAWHRIEDVLLGQVDCSLHVDDVIEIALRA